MLKRRRFHRPLCHYLNLVIRCGGVIVEMVEPQLDPALLDLVPAAVRHVHVPGFIIIQATKQRETSLRVH